MNKLASYALMTFYIAILVVQIPQMVPMLAPRLALCHPFRCHSVGRNDVTRRIHLVAGVFGTLRIAWAMVFRLPVWVT